MPDPQPLDLGPQYPKDPPFTARMRLHQSWYRARVLNVPFGVGPRPTNRTAYGNMLTQTDGEERGLNFLTPHIFTIAKRRLAEKRGTIDRYRLLCNMLSSQPMCFNLFGPLVDDRELATALVQALLPGEAQDVTRVALEYAPEPPGQYLNDRTAFDAFIEYTRPDRRPGFLAVETKYTEPLSQKPYTSPVYRRLTEAPDSPWLPGTWSRLVDPLVNQLWRDHLLAEAMLHHPASRYARGVFMLIHHPLDAETARSITAYRSLLKPEESGTLFRDISLDSLVRSWQERVENQSQTRWLADFTRRYLDFSLSEAEIGGSHGS